MTKWEQTVRKVLAWTISAGLFLGLVFLLTYRYCEQAGSEACRSCLAAGITAAAGGVGAFWPFSKAWNQKPEGVIIWVFLGGTVRLLAGFVGIIFIFLFTCISRTWFLGCYGIFYLFFLLTDSWLMIRLLHYRGLRKDVSTYE